MAVSASVSVCTVSLSVCLSVGLSLNLLPLLSETSLGGVHVEGGLIALDPVWISHVFRSLMLHRDKVQRREKTQEDS